jgi:pimeloyl-ACP methyl ester carboxylesterase
VQPNSNVKPHEQTVEALFVHGMGRSPLSAWPLLRRLERAGVKCSTFGYLASAESFVRITERLASRVAALAARGEYILIGHSLGGVLLRATLSNLPPDTKQPHRLFLLGSPIAASRLAHRMRGNLAYRLFTGECGQLLSSAQRMGGVGHLSAPTTSIVGTGGPVMCGPFKGELNDGVVSVSEASAE